jgi:DNA integrity scanning protein DisA with diadenylate cyclase activity
LKVEFITDFITQKLSGNSGHLAAVISSIMIRKNISSAFNTGKSIQLTVDTIHKELDNNLKSTTKPANIKDILEKMCLEEYDLVDRLDDEYSLNVDTIVKTLKNKTLEKIVEQHFSPQHTRVYRLLSKCGALDAKNVKQLNSDYGNMSLFTERLCNVS